MSEKSQNKKEIENFFIPKSEASRLEMEQKEFFDALKMIAPGTLIRVALDDLINAKMGALIVVSNENVSKLIEKGFEINTKFSSQKLVELAKMDGAIILSHDLKKILYANTFLAPDSKLNTKETGTRHKAAERMAKEAKAIVIAISERRRKMTLYYEDKKHELKETSEVLRRASLNLQILENQRQSLNEVILDLNVLELRNMVTIEDVSKVIQNFEMLKQISEIIRRDLVELGKEGVIVSSRLKDLTRGLDREEMLILKDYFGSKHSSVQEILERIELNSLLEISTISELLFDGSGDHKISPKGMRVLDKTNIPEKHIDALIAYYETLDTILSATSENLMKVFKDENMVDFFKEEMKNLREKISFGKKI